jgi:hypothetical protein
MFHHTRRQLAPLFHSFLDIGVRPQRRDRMRIDVAMALCILPLHQHTAQLNPFLINEAQIDLVPLTFSLMCLKSVDSLHPSTRQYMPFNQLFNTG